MSSRIKLWILLTLLPVAAAVTACDAADDDDADDDDADDDDAGDDDTGDDDTTGDDDDSTPPPPVPPWIEGRLLSCDGSPVAGVAVTACRADRCLFGASDAQGRFVVDGLMDGKWVVHNIGWPGKDQAVAIYENSSFYTIPEISDSANVDIGDATIPCPTEARPIGTGPQMLRFADSDLEVSFDGADIDLPYPADERPEPELRAVQVPQSGWPSHGLEGYTPLVAWAFSPFEAKLDDGGQPGHFQVRIHFAEAPGAAEDLRVLYAHYEADIVTGTFSSAAVTLADNDLVVVADVETLGLVIVARVAE